MARSISGDKIIVTGNEIGSQFPTNRMEIQKEIVLDGRKAPFTIEGGIFSPNLHVLGGGVIKGPVFSSETLRMENDGAQGVQMYLSGITAQKSIVSESTGHAAVEKSLAATMDGLRFIVRGDIVSGERINLQDTCVVGSVKAPQVTLKHSMILGTVISDYHIECLCSAIGMYQSSTITFRGPCSIFSAGGQSNAKPAFENYDDKERFITTLRYIPLCRVKNVGCQMGLASFEEKIDGDKAEIMKKLGVGIACGTWLSGACPFADHVSLGKQDFYDIPRSAVPSSVTDRGKPARKGSLAGSTSSSLWILGIMGRAFSLEGLKKQNDDFMRILHGIFAFEHLSAEQCDEERRIWDRFLSPNELALMTMVTSGLKN